MTTEAPARPRPTTSRATERVIQPGTLAYCAGCDDPVVYRAKRQQIQTICNVYQDGEWNRVEHWHSRCYNRAGQPHGEPDVSQRLPMTAAMKRAAARNVMMDD